MTSNVIQKIELNDDEIVTINKATKIFEQLSEILDAIPTYNIDDQKIHKILDMFMMLVISTEMKKIYSVFNELGQEEKDRIHKIVIAEMEG